MTNYENQYIMGGVMTEPRAIPTEEEARKIKEGEEAKRLYENSLLKKVHNETIERLQEQWRRTDPINKDERESLFFQVVGAENYLQTLENKINEMRMIQRDLSEKNKREHKKHG